MRARLQLGFIFILIIALGTTFIVTKISAEAEAFHLVQDKLLPSQTAMMSEPRPFTGRGQLDGVDKVLRVPMAQSIELKYRPALLYPVNTSREVYSADEHL